MKTTKPLFSRKIKCQNCGSTYYRKTERGKYKYICSMYDKKGGCLRNVISEEYLVELIERRLDVAITREVIEEKIQMIVIENVNPYKLEIHFYDQESILFTSDFIRF